MRPLTHDLIYLGRIVSILSPNGTPRSVCLQGGTIVEAIFVLDTNDADDDLTFDVLINTVDTGIDFTIPNGTPKDIPYIYAPTVAIELEPNDFLHFANNTEQTAAAGVVISVELRL